MHEINDVAFVGVNHPEHGPGLDLWVGGGLSTNPMLAQRVGVWVPLDEVPDVWEAVVSIFRDYGYRRLRAKARLKFLIKDWGIEKFREVLEQEYLKRPLIDGPAPEKPERPIDHIGVQKLRNGLNAIGFSPIAGRVSGTILSKVAAAAEAVGSDRIRFTPYQKLIVLDVPDDKVEELIAELQPLGLHARPSHWRRNLLACSGIEFCKLSFVETRKRSQVLAPELEERLADINAQLDVPITININGCPNSCGRSQIADIGFKGQLVDDGEGNQIEGFQVHLGGSLGLDSAFGRKLRQHKVTSAELGDYIDRVVRNFVKHRNEGERFAQWAVRADEGICVDDRHHHGNPGRAPGTCRAGRSGAGRRVRAGTAAVDRGHVRGRGERSDGVSQQLHRRVEHAGRRAGSPCRTGPSGRGRALPRHRIPLPRDHRHP